MSTTIIKSVRRVAVVGLIAAAVAGVTATAHAITNTPRQRWAEAHAAPYTPREMGDRSVRIAIIGDSLSAGINRTWPNGQWDEHAWPLYANEGDVIVTGGYAISGADSSELVSRVTPTGADVFVILVGTNDVLNRKLDIRETPARLEQMVAESGAGHVIVCALPPAGRGNQVDIDGLNYLNWQYAVLAGARGWMFVDPFVGVRDGDGYMVGASTDGIHMTPTTAAIVGARIHEAALDVMRGDDTKPPRPESIGLNRP